MPEKNFIKKSFFLFLVPRILAIFFCADFMLCMISCSNQDKKSVLNFEAMNTFMSIQSFGKNAGNANKEIQKKLYYIEENISTTKKSSKIFQLNDDESLKSNQAYPTLPDEFSKNDAFDAKNASASENFSGNSRKSIRLDDEFFQLAKFALDVGYKTDGALNIALYPIIKLWGFTTDEYKIPPENEIQRILPCTDFRKIKLYDENNCIEVEKGMQIDFGALGKGFAGDRAMEILKKNGISSALLDFGGNIQALGTKPDGSDWTIGIKNPWDGSVAASLKIHDKSVITSGGYERFFIGDDGKKYIHIFDGKTGHPVENGIQSVTVICESGLFGDAYSTALFVLGLEDACNFWRKNGKFTGQNSKSDFNENFEIIIFTDGQELFYTSGLKGNLKIISDFTKITIID